jgi:alginate O-acetyltransferase complex protein AlgI
MLLVGFVITRLQSVGWARALAWMFVALGTMGVERLAADEPAGVRMVAIIAALFLGMKAVVGVEAAGNNGLRLKAWRWISFVLGWPGMRPALFAHAGEPALAGAGSLIWLGMKRLALGALFIAAARSAWIYSPSEMTDATARIVPTLLLLAGLNLVLHFGLFAILGGLWRLAGVDCRRLFRAPLEARSLGEFWGHRWNLAFSEMTALAICRPVAAQTGKTPAIFLAFLSSGLFHELAISLPVQAGYGLPLLYFCLHGMLVLFERRVDWLKRLLLSRPCLAHLWTLGWLLLPLPLLFHPYFLNEVVWPLIGMQRAYSPG